MQKGVKDMQKECLKVNIAESQEGGVYYFRGGEGRGRIRFSNQHKDPWLYPGQKI
jgi:hypothetical protein